MHVHVTRMSCFSFIEDIIVEITGKNLKEKKISLNEGDVPTT